MLDSLYPKYYLDMAEGDGSDDSGNGEYPPEPTEIPDDLLYYYPSDYPTSGTTSVTTTIPGGITPGSKDTSITKCWSCEPSPEYGPSIFGCKHTSTTQGQRPAGCLSWWQCNNSCDTGRGGPFGFKLSGPTNVLNLPNQPVYRKQGQASVINNVDGSFDTLSADGEIRNYVIMGDIGSKFSLIVSNNDGYDLFNRECEITDAKGFVATITFPKTYEYMSYVFILRAEYSTVLGGGMPKFEASGEISQYVNPTVTLSFATEDPYTTNCAYSGDDVTFTAKPLIEPKAYHTINDKTYGKLTHTVAATITTGYLYIIKGPSITDYLLLDDREGLSTADLDKSLDLGRDETVKNGSIAFTESASKKVITFTSTVQIDKIGKEDTVYELDIDSIITNIPQAFNQEVFTKKDTAITIDVLKGINIATYLTPAITLTPKHGTLVTSSFGAGVGTCVYTPPELFQGVDEFMFEVADGTNTSENQYKISINIGNPTPVGSPNKKGKKWWHKKGCEKQMSCADGYQWSWMACDCVEKTPWW